MLNRVTVEVLDVQQTAKAEIVDQPPGLLAGLIGAAGKRQVKDRCAFPSGDSGRLCLKLVLTKSPQNVCSTWQSPIIELANATGQSSLCKSHSRSTSTL